MMLALTERQRFAIEATRAGIEVIAICGETAKSVEGIIDCPNCSAVTRIVVCGKWGSGFCILCRHLFQVTIGEV